MELTRATQLKGELTVPGDKSISHRAVMFGALAEGTTEVTNFLQGADCLSTISCFRKMGIAIENTPKCILIHGKGLMGLSAPEGTLDTGNSGTTTRLISGILAGQKFTTLLNGDSSIQKRPMKRIIDPLSQMGARIESINGNGCAPLRITGAPLHGIHYTSPVASAQVKSAILLAGLYAQGNTRITEPSLSRNHSEIMLSHFGAQITSQVDERGATAGIQPYPRLSGQKVEVPGDISSAAFFIAAALLVPGSEVLIKNVGINPTRAGILQVAKEMGGQITLLQEHSACGEPVADLLVRYSPLHATSISGPLIPTLIDELPIIAIMASQAEGRTVISDAAELKVKESNRIDAMVTGLKAMGCRIEATEDGMIIDGGQPLRGALVDSLKDHRVAMSFAVAALIASGTTAIRDADCVDISYPQFYQDLKKLAR